MNGRALALSPSRPLGVRASERERESSSLHLRPLHHRLPFFSFPPSATLYPTFSTHLAYAISFSLLFRDVEKMRPSGSEFSRLPPLKKKRKTPFPSLRVLALSPCSSSSFFPPKTREAKLSARKLETVFPPRVLHAYARKQTRAPDGPEWRRFSSLGSPVSFLSSSLSLSLFLSPRASSTCYVEK